MTTLITGRSVVPQAAYTRLVASNPHAWLVPVYYDLEQAFGIRADVLLAQSFHETAYWRSDWFVNHRNMAGIGVTGQTGIGNTYSTFTAGVLAHFAHMAGYVYADERNHASFYDSRWSLVHQRVASGQMRLAQVVTDLDGKWAVPGVGYGASIEALMRAAQGS